MNESTKSLIRHILTALGFVLGLLGVGKATGLIDIILANMDALWEAASTIVGVVLMVIGFLRDKARFATRAA